MQESECISQYNYSKRTIKNNHIKYTLPFHAREATKESNHDT